MRTSATAVLLVVFPLSMLGCITDERPAPAADGETGGQVETRAAPPLQLRPQAERLVRSEPPVTPVHASALLRGPTGPAPTGFVISGTPLTAQLRWNAAANASAYALWRVDGPGLSPREVTPAGFYGTSFTNVVPDPRIAYEFRLVAHYKDGTWGMASAPFTSPPLVNPTGFQAAVAAPPAAPGTVNLRWNAMPGALGYRIDGPALPNTGLYVEQSFATIVNVPPGPHGWQLSAIYPGNYADYQNRPVATAMNRMLPSHGSRWLTKNNGPGSAAEASHHYALFPGSAGSALGALSFHVRGPRYPAEEELREELTGVAVYTNTTELGARRTAECWERDYYLGGLVTDCWTTSDDRTLSLIRKDQNGMIFMQFERTGPPDPGVAADLKNVAPEKYRRIVALSGFTLTDRATFDSEGPKFVPHVCLSCHGGRYDPNTKRVVGATLLPLDPTLLQLHPGAEGPVQQINDVILRSNPSPAVVRYIQTGFASGWAQEPNLYRSIVKPYCTMCHLATPSHLDFSSAGKFFQYKALIYAAVCSARSMPHAEQPFKAFWTADTGPLFVPGLLAMRLGYKSCP